MKKLFLFSVAALAFCACSNDEVVSENKPTYEPKEISFAPLTKPNTRAAILDGTFPTTSAIQVAAYDAQNSKNFFNAAEFTYNSNNQWWGCSSPKYWPLSPATINFLGYANLTSGSAVWSSPNAAGVTLTMADNSSSQNDLMYAVGQGKVTQEGNSLVIPDKVDMVFKHAQALLTFNVKANVASTITLKKITLNNAYFGGTLTIDNSNYNSTGTQSITSATWGTPTEQKTTLDIFNATYAVTTSSEKKADIMVVPHPSAVSFDSFTLTYEIGGNDYKYTFTPVDRNLAQATKYVYDITFTVHEIFINASVDPWTETTPINFDVPTREFTYVASTGVTGTYNMLSATAGTYTVSIKGLPADSYKAVEGTGTADFITAVSPSTDTAVAEGEAFNVSFTVTAAAGKNQTVLINNDEGTTLFTLTVAQP